MRFRRASAYQLDADAITQLYREHGRSIVIYCARRTLDTEVALDLTAETFAQAYRDRRQFHGASADEAVGWIYGIAKHQISAFFKRGQAERRALRALGLEAPQATDAELERIEDLAELDELRGIIGQGLSQLSPDHSEALRLRVVEERTYADMAALLGLPEPAVRARVSRGLRSLRSIVGDDLVMEER